MNIEMVKNLYGQVNEMNAGEGHVEIGSIFGDKEATLVVSVYQGARPSHKILDDLFVWAEDNKLDNVVEKIRELGELEESQED